MRKFEVDLGMIVIFFLTMSIFLLGYFLGSSLNLLMPSSATTVAPTAYPPFKRKRGRPPKNPVIDVHVFPSTPNGGHSQAMFSSFKLGKGGVLMDIRQESAGQSAQQRVRAKDDETTYQSLPNLN